MSTYAINYDPMATLPCIGSSIIGDGLNGGYQGVCDPIFGNEIQGNWDGATPYVYAGDPTIGIPCNMPQIFDDEWDEIELSCCQFPPPYYESSGGSGGPGGGSNTGDTGPGCCPPGAFTYSSGIGGCYCCSAQYTISGVQWGSTCQYY